MEAKTTQLIKEILAGNDDAFKKLYEAYVEYALRTTYIITQNQNHAADIVQETFIKVYRNLHRYNMSMPFKPWFYTILINESRRYMNKQNKEPFAVDSETLIHYLHDEQGFEVKGNVEILEKAFYQLNEMHRTVLILKYVHHFKEKEIADILNLNVNTVKSRLFKGRNKLRNLIGGETI